MVRALSLKDAEFVPGPFNLNNNKKLWPFNLNKKNKIKIVEF